jgi:hypothetical protein
MMPHDIRQTVDGRLSEDLAAFRRVWAQAERGETVIPDRVLAFQSRKTLSALDGRVSGVYNFVLT